MSAVAPEAPNQPDWDGLFAVAQTQSGYFTTAQAAQSGYSRPLLHKYLATGRVVRVRRGVYRVVHFPASEHEDLIVLWLWAEQAGVFSHETALALHDLSDALPGKVHMTVPPSWRRRRLRVPVGLVLHFADVGDVDRASYSAVPVTAPLRTLRDCIEANVAADLVRQGILQARRRGIVSAKDEARLLSELGSLGRTGCRAMTARHYATPLAFKQALEQRLKSSSVTGVDFARRRQLLVFDRFLARLAQVAGDAVTLKGGLVLELRLARARTTKDIDLRMMGSSDDVLERLQEAGRLDLGDHMLFEVQADADHPEIQNEGMRYDGFRYRTECRLAGMIYSRPFGVDVAFGDPLVGEPDIVAGDDILGFAGIAPPALRLYPVVSHIAEKLHAFTMPRPRPNTRVRDLPDLALLATTGPIDGPQLRLALSKTFEFRGTHALPVLVPAPLSFWEGPYSVMAANDELPWANLERVADVVSSFLNPVLGGEAVGTWDPETWAWVAPERDAFQASAGSRDG